MKNMHTIQLRILRDLLFCDSAKYSDLKPLNMENSQFVFHLNKLNELGLIEKSEAIYSLTPQGKEFANRMTTEDGVINNMVKATTVLVAIRENTEREFLIYKRLKNPFYGCTGFPTEKPKWGETLEQAAVRGLLEETNLQAEAQLFAVKHYVVSHKDTIVEDKLMHGFILKDPTGKLLGSSEGEYIWVKESKLKEVIQRPLVEFWDFYNAFIKFDGTLTFEEHKVTTDLF